MNRFEGVAAPVQAILTSARSRTDNPTRIDVTARPLEPAIAATTANGTTPIIGEVKPTSPTTDTHHDHDPVTAAKAMVDGGATAISVLTEPTHFNGSLDALTAVRDAVDVPVLRKDFLLEEPHLDAVPADLVLLITRFLEDLDSMLTAARDRGLQPLVEVHTKPELQTALDAGATRIGINARDLTTLTVDRTTIEQLAPHIPNDVTIIAESGVTDPRHLTRYHAAGADATLVGSTIMAADDITARTKELVTT